MFKSSKHLVIAAGVLALLVPLTARGSQAAAGLTPGLSQEAVGPQDPLQRAQAAIAAGRPDEALLAVREVLASNPDDVQALILEGAAHEALGADDDAMAAYQRALAADPASGAAYVQLGWLYIRTDRAVAAIAPLERARELLPDQALPRALLAAAYRAAARPADASAVLKEALAIEPDSGNLWLDAADAADAAGDVPTAIAAAAEAVRLLPDEIEPALLRAWLLLRANDTDHLVQAPAAFRNAIRLDADSEPAWRGLSESYVELAMWEEAEAAQRRVIEVSAPAARDWMSLAFSQARLGKYADATRGYTRAIAIEPGAGWAWFYRGEALVNLDRQPEGLADLRRAVDLLGGETVPLLVLANTLTERGDAMTADMYLARAAKLEPRNPEIGLAQGRSWVRQERYAEAIPLLRALLAAMPQMNEARYLLGQSLMRTDATEEGRALLEEYQASGGEQQQARREGVADRDRVLLVRGRVLAAEGRWGDALVPLRAAVELSPDQRETWELLLRCYEQLGDANGAATARARLAEIG